MKLPKGARALIEKLVVGLVKIAKGQVVKVFHLRSYNSYNDRFNFSYAGRF